MKNNIIYRLCKYTKLSTILFEEHSLGCRCSYCCGDHKLHYGLNIPNHWWGWNSWYVIKLWRGSYFRWTNSWLRWFNQYCEDNNKKMIEK